VASQKPVLNEEKRRHFRDCVLFHEYFHGDTGRGAGASHQTGWTGLVAKLLQPRRPEPVTDHCAGSPAVSGARSEFQTLSTENVS
jgi:hypothetical protein